MTSSRTVTLEHTSSILRGNPLGDLNVREVEVYLPPGYDEASSTRYPTIWVLAPFASWGRRLFNLQAWDENIVQRMDRLTGEGRVKPMILVFPDCFTRYGGSQYVNSTAVGAYEDYITVELLPFIDGQFRTLAAPDYRAVMGHSSGGYGALMLAMRHPELFGAVASHSGDMGFEFCYWPDIPGAVRTLESVRGVEGFMQTFSQRDKGKDWFSALNLIAMSACYSPDPDSPHGFDLLCDSHTGAIKQAIWQRWLEQDPVRIVAQFAEALRSLKGIYFDCGRRDEYNLFLGARMLHQVLEEQDISHVYEEFDGGHSGINWRYDTSLPFLSEALASQSG